MVAIKAAHKASRNIYGSPQLHRELVAQEHTVGHDHVARLMRDNLLKASVKDAFEPPLNPISVTR